MKSIKYIKILRKYGIVCGILCISLYSCAIKKNTLPVLEVSTSGCLGECPIIDVVLKDNILYFNLIKNTSKKGVYTYVLSEVEINKLKKLWKDVHFEELNEKYSSDRVDMQVYNSRIIIKDTDTMVYFYEDEAPLPFQKFILQVLEYRHNDIVEVSDIIRIKTRASFKEVSMPVPPMPIE